MSLRFYLRVTADQLEARAAELDASGWIVAGASRYGEGISILLVRFTPAPSAPEEGTTP